MKARNRANTQEIVGGTSPALWSHMRNTDSLPSLEIDVLTAVIGGCKKKAAPPPPPPPDSGSVEVEVSTGVQAGASQAPQLL